MNAKTAKNAKKTGKSHAWRPLRSLRETSDRYCVNEYVPLARLYLDDCDRIGLQIDCQIAAVVKGPLDGLDPFGLLERRRVLQAGGKRVQRHRRGRRNPRTLQID